MAMDRVRNWSKTLPLMFNLVFLILLIFFLFSQTKSTSPLFLRRKTTKSSYRWGAQASRSNLRPQGYDKKRTNFSPVARILAENSSEVRHFVAVNPVEQGRTHNPAESPNIVVQALEDEENAAFCRGVKQHLNYGSECEYMKAQDLCSSGGFIEYIEFYCACGKVPVFGYIVGRRLA